MKASPVYIPGWLVLINFSLSFIVSASKDGIYFPTKSEIACRMTKDLRCDGAFISRIATTCGHQQQGKNLRNDKAGPLLGIPCKRNRDCRMKRSACYRGTCLCKLGRYFSPRQNACLPECDEYGDGMDIYKEAGIGRHNDKTYFNTTQTRCCDLCVRETAFTCLTAEWFSGYGKCCLSKSGYLDVFVLDRLNDERDWILAQRRCK